MPRKGANKAEEAINNWANLPGPNPILDKEGACVGAPNTGFFLESTSRKHPDLMFAKSLCAVCPVRQVCLDYAMSIPKEMDYGVWGGTTRNERLKLRGITRKRYPNKKANNG